MTEKQSVPCRSCDAPMIWMKTQAGKNIPVDAATYQWGDKIFDRNKHTTHFDTCPKADKHRQRSSARPSSAKDKPQSPLDPHCEKMLLAYLEAVKVGKDFDIAGAEFLAAIENKYRPFDDEIPF